MTSRRIRWSAALLVCGAASGILVSRLTQPEVVPDQAEAAKPPVSGAQRLTAHGRLPLAFEPNVGQAAAPVRYLTRGAGYQLYFTPDGATWALTRAGEVEGAPLVDVLRMRVVGAAADAPVTGSAPLAARAHYFRGDDPAQWRTNVPTFGRVRYARIYPGVDLEYYGRDGELEYDFVVAPGADPSVIALAFDGADGMSLDDAGNLVLETPAGRLVQGRPLTYQQIGTERRRVDSRFVLGEDEVRFELGAYDPQQPLVIDPVISYSTFIGGTGGAYGDQAYGVTVDAAENVYITGKASSTTFPVQNGQPANLDAFVLKMAPDGSLVYVTVISGNGSDSGEGIAVDAQAQVAITGFTDSTNFPTVNAIHLDRNARDAFLLKLDASGQIVYSTYLGGSDAFDYGEAVVFDAAGKAYVTGSTKSSNFPVLSALQPVMQGQDAFVVIVDPAGNQLYGTFLGGSGNEAAESIALDPDGSFFVTGWTTSSNFPRAGLNTVKNSGEDVFISRFVADGSAFVYSRYLGGNSNERPFAIVSDGAGGAYVGGRTDSTNFPAVLALQGDQVGTDAFLTRLGSTGLVQFSTYLGGNGWERILGLAVRDGQLFVTGQTYSTDFPVLDAVQSAKAGDATTADAFVTTIDVATSLLASSTYLGGAGNEEGRGVAPVAGKNVFVTGWTESSDFPTVRAIQAVKSNVGNAFVTRIAAVGVDAVAPDFTLSAGGQTLTISGQDFVAGATVQIGGVAASGVTVLDGSTLTATAPALSTLGPVDVTVRNPDGGTGTLYAGLRILNGTGPVADAGVDQSVEATGASGAVVALDGTASFDPDNEPMTFEWRNAQGQVIATGATASPTLPIGVNTLTLTVSDGHSAPGTDTVTISVVDSTAPVVVVVSPNSAERLYTATPAVIEWTASDAASGLSGFDVYFSTDGGTSYGATPVCANVPASARTCVWAAPGPATTKGRIRVVARDASGNTAGDASNAAFIIVSGSAYVTVTAPNTNVNWGAGSTQQIKWNHNLGTSGYTRLELSVDGGASWSLIHPGVKNTAGGTGVFNWIVAHSLTASARVRASWVHGAATDDSNTSFTIAAPSIQLTAPPGTGANWGYGTKRTQKWTSNLGPTDRVDVVLARGQAAPVTILAGLLASANTATFVTPVLASPTADAQIQVIWSNAPAGFTAVGTSVPFTVEAPFVSVTAPNGAEIWAVGTNKKFTWNNNLGSLENVRIELSSDDGASYPIVVRSSTPSDGTETITINSAWVTTAGRVRISWVLSPGVVDVSNNSFVIR